VGLIFFANTDGARDSTIFAISTFGLGNIIGKDDEKIGGSGFGNECDEGGG